MKIISIFVYKKLENCLNSIIEFVNLFNESFISIILFQDKLLEAIKLFEFVRQFDLEIIIIDEKYKIFDNFSNDFNQNIKLLEMKDIFFILNNSDCIVYLI